MEQNQIVSQSLPDRVTPKTIADMCGCSLSLVHRRINADDRLVHLREKPRVWTREEIYPVLTVFQTFDPRGEWARKASKIMKEG